jgi:3-oxoacyl-[acyl-carrier protein] reductase
MFDDFKGQTVIVTGGTRGIGAAVTDKFLSLGAKVTALYRGGDRNAADFRAARADKDLEVVKTDVSDPALVEGFFTDFDKTHSSLEILVNCAGIRRDAVAGMMSAADWSAVISANLSGTFYMTKQAVLRMMRARYGRIISISSPMARLGFPGQSNYSASKAGQEAMTKSVAKETAKRGITVNCVAPGFIETDFIGDLGEEVRKQYKAMVPAARFGKPEEVAAAVVFLASKEAAYITGATLEISGGL